MSKNTPPTPTPNQAQQRDKSDELSKSPSAQKPGTDAAGRAGQASAHKGETDSDCGCSGGGSEQVTKGSTEDAAADSEV